MTHAYFKFDREIHFDECHIERYPSNNCIVLLQNHPQECLVLIQGEHIGVYKADPDHFAVTRAEPVMRMILTLRNEAFNRGVRHGKREQLNKIKEALGV